MKVQLNDGREFLVVWHHRLPQAQNSAKMSALSPAKSLLAAKTEEGTSCYIYEILGGNKTLCCSIDLYRYYKDTYSKEVGRKYSLERALQQCGFSKPERQQFWDAYFDRKPNVVKTAHKNILEDIFGLFSGFGDQMQNSRQDSPDPNQSQSAKQ